MSKVQVIPADKQRYCEWPECGGPIAKLDSQSWTIYKSRRFCSQPCSSAWRRAQPCPTCGGQNWYTSPDGRRACRPCKTRRSRGSGTKSPKIRRPLAVTLPVDIPDAPPRVQPPAWRPASWIEQEKRRA